MKIKYKDCFIDHPYFTVFNRADLTDYICPVRVTMQCYETLRAFKLLCEKPKLPVDKTNLVCRGNGLPLTYEDIKMIFDNYQH